MLEQMKVALLEAQTEQQVADIALMEATARSQTANEAATRLETAVLALKGQTPVVPTEVAALSGETAIITDVDPRKAMSHDEFEADRVERQRKAKKARKKEEMENNPYAHIKCSGCGKLGTLQDTITQAPSGATVRMMVCHKCNNQIMA